MTPRRFVESLRRPLAMAWEPPGTSLNACRLAEIDGWLWVEAHWPEWGEGGKAFVMRARAAVEAQEFEQWLGNLPPRQEERRP
jgi:hypothetical protein